MHNPPSPFGRCFARVQGSPVIEHNRGMHMFGDSICCGVFFLLAPASCASCFQTGVAQSIHTVRSPPRNCAVILHPFVTLCCVFNTCGCMRGSLAFAAILVGVGLSAVGNVFASSLATMFPAVFLSTMVGLWLSHEVLNLFYLAIKLFLHFCR
jgi:hypothetical protein